jgi:hypothetical protein
MHKVSFGPILLENKVDSMKAGIILASILTKPYCRREQLSGERFQTKVCKTARRILEDEQRGKDLINSVDRIGLQSGR